MASACEKTGNYSFAVTCAELRYKYTKKTSDLARCAEDGILSKKDKLIVKYGEKLTAREDFLSLCESKDESFLSGYGYRHYICASLSAAQYRNGDFNKAVATASSAGSLSFSKLVIEVVENGTKEQAQTLVNSLADFNDTNAQNLTVILNQFLGTGE